MAVEHQERDDETVERLGIEMNENSVSVLFRDASYISHELLGECKARFLGLAEPFGVGPVSQVSDFFLRQACRASCRCPPLGLAIIAEQGGNAQPAKFKNLRFDSVPDFFMKLANWLLNAGRQHREYF